MTKEEAPEQIDCGKQCPCQFGDAECAFPDCYSKDELVNVIEKKNGFITQLQEQVAALKKKSDADDKLIYSETESTYELQKQVAELEEELENERARGIHSCGPNCNRPLCVANRKIKELEDKLDKCTNPKQH